MGVGVDERRFFRFLHFFLQQSTLSRQWFEGASLDASQKEIE
jgi:hypothetical protein